MNNSKSKFSIESLEKSYGIHGNKKLLIYSGEKLIVTNELSLLLQHCDVNNIILKLILNISIHLGVVLGDHTMTSYMITSTMLNSLLLPKSMNIYPNLFPVCEDVILNHCSVVRCIHCIIQTMYQMQHKIEEMLLLPSGIVYNSNNTNNTNNGHTNRGTDVGTNRNAIELYEYENVSHLQQWCKSVWKHIIYPASGESISNHLSSILVCVYIGMYIYWYVYILYIIVYIKIVTIYCVLYVLYSV